MMNRKVHFAVIFLMMSALVLSACAQSTSTSTDPANTASQENNDSQTGIDTPIKIGMTSAITGPYSEFGEGIRRAAEIAVEEWNAKGGINGQPIEFIVLDDQLKAEQAASNFQQLIEKEKVHAVIGPAGSGPTLAVLPRAIAEGIPYINPIAQTVTITYPDGSGTEPYKNIFSFAIQNDVEAEVIAKYVGILGFKKVALLGESTPYGQSGLDIVEELLQEQGVEILGREQYDQQATNVTAQLSKLNKPGIEALICIGLGADAATVIKDANRLAMHVPMVGTNGMFSIPFVELAGDLVVGNYGATNATYATSDLHPAAKSFAQKWKEKYGNDRWYGPGDTPQSFFAQNASGYDAINLFLTSIEQAGTLEYSAIIEQMNQADFEATVIPRVTFTENVHHAITVDSMKFGQYIKENNEIFVNIID